MVVLSTRCWTDEGRYWPTSGAGRGEGGAMGTLGAKQCSKARCPRGSHLEELQYVRRRKPGIMFVSLSFNLAHITIRSVMPPGFDCVK